MACESFVVRLVGILLTTDVVPKIFPNLNVIGHLPVPAGWGSCLLRLAIFIIAFTTLEWIPYMESLYSQSGLPPDPFLWVKLGS